MNIFFLDFVPEVAAKYHCNKHVVKMIVETAQLLSTSHPPECENIYKVSKAQRSNPIARWVRQSIQNYRWTARLGVALCGEYSRRYYGRIHKTQATLQWLIQNEPLDLPNVDLTPPHQSMPEHLRSNDAVASYRRLYIEEKSRFAVWNACGLPEDPPAWYSEGISVVYSNSTNSQRASSAKRKRDEPSPRRLPQKRLSNNATNSSPK